ncbi:MAG TPA: hypothetical protein VFR67_02665 [Pilimelia sp.]|nr:hypothetical protein [Pilimelia sp.]
MRPDAAGDPPLEQPERIAWLDRPVVARPRPARRVGRPLRAFGRWLRRSPVGRLVTYAAVLLLGVGIGGYAVWSYTAADRVRAATVTSRAGGVAGRLFVYEGTPSWLLATITNAPADGAYEMGFLTRDGQRWRVGRCMAVDRVCTVGTAIDVAVRDISLVRFDPPGWPGTPTGPGMLAMLD